MHDLMVDGGGASDDRDSNMTFCVTDGVMRLSSLRRKSIKPKLLAINA